MKKIFILFLIVFAALNLFSQQKEKQSQSETVITKKQGTIIFKSKSYDFGKIAYASDGNAEFTFKNIGKTPILISNIKTSCGCTQADWTKTPIKRKEKSKITVTYDTQKIGKFHKTISVFLEGEEEAIQLEIKGEVLPK